MPRASSTSRLNRSATVARIDVVVKPGSKEPGIAVADSIVVVRVRERAIEGAANDACIKAIAERLGVAPSSIALVRGARGRFKLFTVDGLTTSQVIARIVPERASDENS